MGIGRRQRVGWVLISRAANKTPLQDTYYSRRRRRRHYHHRCRQRPCRAHITPARHHGRTSTRYECLQYIYYHMNRHKLTPSSITSLAQTRSLGYVRFLEEEKRERGEGRIDEDDEIETLAREERRGATGRPEKRIRGKFHDARRPARRYCGVVAWYQHRGTVTHTNIECDVRTFVTSTDVNYRRCL